MAINSRPLRTMQEEAARQRLERYTPYPALAESLGKAFTRNKTFVVVDAPEKADFVMRVCGGYPDDIIGTVKVPKKMPPQKLEIAEARMVPAANFLANPDTMNAPMWKATTPDTTRPLPLNADGKKKDKVKPIELPGDTVDIGRDVLHAKRDKAYPADIEDLVIYFSQDYLKLNPVKILQRSAAKIVANSSGRPALTNKPNDALPENAKGENAANTTPETEEVIKIDTSLVYVPIRVMDKDGKYIPNLTKNDFQVFEDNAKQEIENFSNVDDPFHVVLLLDMSGTTRFHMGEIREAALEFIGQLRPQDKVAVISFENAVYVDADFTNDRAQLTQAILRTQTGNKTRLHDAIDLVLSEKLNRIQGRKAILLFSDGADSASRLATAQQNFSKIEESNVLIYPIQYTALVLPPRFRNGRQVQMHPEELKRFLAERKTWLDRATTYINELAIRSGGRSYEAATIRDAKSAFANIAEELRRQYWLSYYSRNSNQDGGFRAIRVVVSQAESQKWAVRAKTGYRAPKK
ncbi:MAG: VWA domain-containing protein [Blastocatellia bacterium]|nr:VWA domain-containing protein [Blastocatellia bacterium]